MKEFLSEIFVWWHGQTWGTRLYLRLFFTLVGSDDTGNRYYEDKKRNKRWVIYPSRAEASLIPPGWHGWMHHRTDTPPSNEKYEAHTWEKPHLANMTGTALAYRPDGSLLNKGERPKVTGDYDAWSPEG